MRKCSRSLRVLDRRRISVRIVARQLNGFPIREAKNSPGGKNKETDNKFAEIAIATHKYDGKSMMEGRNEFSVFVVLTDFDLNCRLSTNMPIGNLVNDGINNIIIDNVVQEENVVGEIIEFFIIKK